MVVRVNAHKWGILEQIVFDLPSGLTLQFEVMPDGTQRLRIIAEHLPFGNREIIFNVEGYEAGGGTYVGNACPSWHDEESNPQIPGQQSWRP